MASPNQPLKASVAVPERRLATGAANLPKLVIGKEWADWLFDLDARTERSPERQSAVRATAQAAAIGVTALNVIDQAEGVWRISWQVRVSQVATTSSSVQVTIHWTQGGVAQTFSGALLNGNLTTTREGATIVIRSDDAAPISFSVAYASVGAQVMQYEIDVVAELVVTGA